MYENLLEVINQAFNKKRTVKSLEKDMKFAKNHPNQLNCLAYKRDKGTTIEDPDTTIELCVEYNREEDGYYGTGFFLSILDHTTFHSPGHLDDTKAYFTEDIGIELKNWLETELAQILSV